MMHSDSITKDLIIQSVGTDNHKIVPNDLRDGVLDEVGKYCANLSQSLFFAYSNNIISAVLALEWNNDLYLTFLQYKRLIDTLGSESACNSIMLNLLELVKQSQKSKI